MISSYKVKSAFNTHYQLFLSVLVIVFHFFVSYLLISTNNKTSASLDSFISLSELGSELLLSGIFLYSILAVRLLFGRTPKIYYKLFIGVLCFSIAISILLATDKANAKNTTGTPKSFSEVFYVLITERHALLVLILLTIAVIVVATYYLIKTLFKETYSGSGLQIKIPGQTIYYLPIYPQISWQNTGVDVQEGDKIEIELSGYVSPGALQEIGDLKRHMETFVDWQKRGSKPEDWKEPTQALTWPYTSPAGYDEEDYGPAKKLEVFKNHPIYKQDYYYRDDTLLTVQGMPHNRVIGTIHETGQPLPREAAINKPAYNWNNKEDREELICLSSNHYPITVIAKKTGKLFVVINDVDIARWDNGGLFFLKLITGSL